MQIPKLSFFLALIVFDFYSFKGSKMHFTGETNIYIFLLTDNGYSKLRDRVLF